MKKITTLLLLIVLAFMPFLTLSEAHAAESDFNFPSVTEKQLNDADWYYSGMGYIQYDLSVRPEQRNGWKNEFSIPLYDFLFSFSDTLVINEKSYKRDDLRNKNKFEGIFSYVLDGTSNKYEYSLRYWRNTGSTGHINSFTTDSSSIGISVIIEFPDSAFNDDGKLNTYNENSKWTEIDGYYYYDKHGQIEPEIIQVGQMNVYPTNIYAGAEYMFNLPKDYLIQYSTDKNNWINSPLDNVLYVHFLKEKYHNPELGVISGYQLSGYHELYVRYKNTSIVNPNNPDEPLDPTDPDIKWNQVSDLPSTFTALGNVKFQVDGLNLVMQVTYNNKSYLLKYAFNTGTNMKMFDSTKEAYYMNPNGDKPQIFINKSNNFYLKDVIGGGEAKAFVPHAIWDLKDNKIANVDTYTAYSYVKQNDKGAHVAYFYVDEFIIDKILNAKIRYTHREVKRVLWETKYGEWLTEDWQYTSDQQLVYRDFTSNWTDSIPGWNLIALNIKKNQTFKMPRIEDVNLNSVQSYYNITKGEIEDVFKKVDSNFTELSKNPRYKLWAFALQEGQDYSNIVGNRHTEIYPTIDKKDPKSLQFVEIVYMTDGKIYTTVGDHQDLKGIVNNPVDPINPGGENTSETNWPLTVAAAFLVLGVVFGLAQNKFKPGKSLNYLLTIGIIAVAIYLVMVFWPQISAALYVFRL